MSKLRDMVSREIDRTGGVLGLDPAWVARDWLRGGRRLGLADHEYDVGERGMICERWLASVTPADNRVGPPEEGVSRIRVDGGTVSLKQVDDEFPELIVGPKYAAEHGGLARLAKIFDYEDRIPFHIHPPQHQASLVGARSKDEAYYYLDADLGAHPEIFLGLHAHVTAARAAELLLPHLERWQDAAVLGLSKAYLQQPGRGFFVPSGVLHAPGTALTLELQEDSDTLAMFQALNAGTIIDKELLFKDVSPEDRSEIGERALLRWIDWQKNTDPLLFETSHIVPTVRRATSEFEESWILTGSPKFAGRRLRIVAGAEVELEERGAFSVFVWRGQGTISGTVVRAGHPGHDEVLVVHDAAVNGVRVRATGVETLEIFLIFGPGLNPDAPPAGLQVNESC